MTETGLIARYFSRPANSPNIVHSIGDDAAVVSVPEGYQLVMTMDTFASNVHFPYSSDKLILDTDQAWHTTAFDIGYKAVAVNLSDIAAMGAEPSWLTLSISLPEVNEQWLEQFSAGMHHLLEQSHVTLIGGDVSRGPLSITIQAEGLVPQGKALLRSGAQVGDLVYVSGELGTAAYVLQQLRNGKTVDTSLQHLLPALRRPKPQLALGIALRDIASSCIDLSDGLFHDLKRIARASQVGIKIDVSTLPVAQSVSAQVNPAEMQRLAATGGDDYQLCFTVPAAKQTQINTLAEKLQVSLTAIGVVTEGDTVQLENYAFDDAEKIKGFDHFQ